MHNWGYFRSGTTLIYPLKQLVFRANWLHFLSRASYLLYARFLVRFLGFSELPPAETDIP